MRKSCQNCLCSSCLNICGCCGCTDSKKNIKKCKQYCQFKQMDIFDFIKKQNKKLPRDKTFNDYGIEKKRYEALKKGCLVGEYQNDMLLKACAGFEFIAPWIILSVTQKKSYDRLEFDMKLGRIPCGRTDFYGYRRMFFDNLDKVDKSVQITPKNVR